MLSALYAKFIEQENKEQRLAKLILRHKRALQKLQERGGWWNCCLIPLADKLSEILNMPYEIYGPFGLGAETSIYFFPDGKCGDIVKNDTYGIMIRGGKFQRFDSTIVYTDEEGREVDPLSGL